MASAQVTGKLTALTASWHSRRKEGADSISRFGSAISTRIVHYAGTVVETPQLGHATFVFAKTRSIESFFALYTRIAKEDIRRNRDNAAEQLGFLGRVIHGTNPRVWLKEIRQRLGKKIDFASVVAE